MNLTWKKTAAMIIGGLVTASLVAPVLADSTTPAEQSTNAKPGIRQFAQGMGMMGRGGKGGMMGKAGGMMRGGQGGAGMMMKGLGNDQLLVDAAKGAGMTVEDYQAKLQAEAQANRQAQADLRQTHQDQVLADAAKGAGMTVEEYQAKLEADRQTAMVERYAEKQGITVDEAKAQLKDKVLSRIGNMAKRLGITLDDLKAYIGQ